MGRFETVVELQNQYGETVCELEFDGNYYELPKGFKLDNLDIGDVYRVVEVERER